MTNIEEKFYKTFGIEKKKEYGCTDSWDMCYHQKEYPNCKGCPFWKLIDIEYPEITNRILLEMICIVTRYMNEIRQFDSVDELKKATLEELITLVEDDNFHEKCYEDVQSLFKGGSRDEKF